MRRTTATFLIYTKIIRADSVSIIILHIHNSMVEHGTAPQSYDVLHATTFVEASNFHKPNKLNSVQLSGLEFWTS